MAPLAVAPRARRGHQSEMIALAGAAGRRAEPSHQRRAHLLGGEGFRHVIVHPRGQALLAVAFDRARGQGYDRACGGRIGFLLADLRGRLEPVHLGHLAIHEDQAVLAARIAFERFEAVRGGLDLAAQALEDADRDFQVDRIVLDEQDARSCNPFRRWRRRKLRGRRHRLDAAFQPARQSRRSPGGRAWSGCRRHGRASRRTSSIS